LNIEDRMPTDKNMVTDAAISLLNSMRDIQKNIQAADDTSVVIPKLEATWGMLERQVIDMLDDCAQKWMTQRPDVILANSPEILRRLPPATSSHFNKSKTASICDAISPETYGVAIEQGFLNANFADRILKYRPGCEAWTSYIVDVLSPKTYFRAHGGALLWTEAGLAEIGDADRTMRVLKAQIEHAPAEMNHCIFNRLLLKDTGPDIPLALYLAGARCERVSQLMQEMESHHSLLALIGRHGTLEEIIARHCTAPRDLASNPRITR
jgi:hypothetical protein